VYHAMCLFTPPKLSLTTDGRLRLSRLGCLVLRRGGLPVQSTKLTALNAYVDPRVANYFMMSSPWASLVVCVLYVVAVEWLLPRFMDSRKPLEFRPLIVAYNFAMVLLSGYIFLEVCTHGFHVC